MSNIVRINNVKDEYNTTNMDNNYNIDVEIVEK